MPDSHACILIINRVPSELRLSTGKVLPIPGAQSVPPSALGEYKPGRSYEGLGITEEGHVLVACVDASRDNCPPGVNLVSLSLKESATPPHVTPISLPKDRSLQLMALSPDKRHLLWLLSRNTVKHVRGNRARPVEDASRPNEVAILHYELWISRVDGTEMAQLGWVETQLSSANLSDFVKRYRRFSPVAVQWMPDSQHISFVYKDALYSIPVDWPGDPI
jgi:hypothetical protein